MIVDYSADDRNYIGPLSGICFDEVGNAYVSGHKGGAKFDQGGNIVAVNKDVGGNDIACIGGKLYLTSSEVTSDRRLHQLLYVLDSELRTLDRMVLNAPRTDGGFGYHSLAFDGRHLYVAGYDLAPKKRIVVYAIEVGRVSGRAYGDNHYSRF